MAEGRLYSGKKMIAVYLDPAEADQFKTLARSQKTSTSNFMQRIISVVLAKGQSADTRRELSVLSEDKRKKQAFTVHLAEGEAKRLLSEAKRHEMRPSPFIRLILRGALTKTISFSAVDHDEIRKLRTELTRIGTNLNQAVKLLKMNPYDEKILSAEDIKIISQVVNSERESLRLLLEKNLASWANIVPE